MSILKKFRKIFSSKNTYPENNNNHTQGEFNSADYWEKRYKSGGNSGAGSYGRLVVFKSRFINQFIQSNNLKTMIEHGCGDGNLASMITVDNYVGIDVSMTAVELCKSLMSADDSKKFLHSENQDRKQQYDLSLSSDVIFHLIEDDIYYNYMCRLFDSSSKYVIIYSSNHENNEKSSIHVRHRNFVSWIKKHREDFRLATYKRNKFPYDAVDSNNTSFSDFYIYERKNLKFNADISFF